MRGTAGCLSFHSYEQKHSLVHSAIQPFKYLSASLAARNIRMTYFWSITKGLPFIDT